MDSDRIKAAVVIFTVVVGIPLGLLALVFRLAEPQDRPNSDRNKYPDDLFI